MRRDERKRTTSPLSFFYGRGWGLVLAANYFRDSRLAAGYSAVAAKHRHRLQSATFGMVMAAFEWCIKDYIAQIVSASDLYDGRVEAAKWIDLDKSRILAQREATASIGAILIHPTQGWHDPANLSDRYSEIFERSPIQKSDHETLGQLWILRHSIAHNAGFVTNHDAYRLRAPSLSERSVRIDDAFLNDTWGFLMKIVHGLADPVGTKVLTDWFAQRATGDWEQDRQAYEAVKNIVTLVESRDQDLPAADEAAYHADSEILT